MNSAVYIFILASFMVLKAMMIPGATVSVLGTPTLNTFPVSEDDFSALVEPIEVEECEILVLCLNVPFSIVAEFIMRIFDFLVIVIKIIANIIIFIIQIIAMIAALAVTSIPGAPIYINILLISIPAIMLGLALINAFKPGVSAE